MVGRACLLEVDEVKLIVVYIYWGLKKHYASREDISLIKTQQVQHPNILASSFILLCVLYGPYKRLNYESIWEVGMEKA